MSLPQSFYLAHLHRETSYRATWLPGLPLKIGDVGRLEDGLFTVYTTLAQEGIDPTTRDSASSLGFDYSKKDSFAVSTNAEAGQNGVKGKIDISFGMEGGFIFQMTKSRLKVIDNMKEIEESILSRYKEKKWRKEWVVITQLVTADNATIFISTASNTSIQLECDISAEFQGLKLADPSIHLKVTKESSSVLKLIAEPNLSPLYQVRGIRKPFLGNPRLRLRANEDLTAQNDSFIDLPFDEKEIS